MDADTFKRQMDQVEAEIGHQPKATQRHFYTMVANGESPRFAAMCAMRRAPMTKYSDRTFNQCRQETMMAMPEWQRDAYVKIAQRSGIATQGKFYVGGLGRPSDIAAWVSTVEDVKQVCREKNLNADGLVHHVASPRPYKRTRLASSLCKELVGRRLAEDPQLAAKCKADPSKLRQLQAEVVDRHSKPSSTSDG